MQVEHSITFDQRGRLGIAANEQIRRGYELVLGRQPRPEETAELSEFVRENGFQLRWRQPLCSSAHRPSRAPAPAATGADFCFGF